jgi:hypothetical protein
LSLRDGAKQHLSTGGVCPKKAKPSVASRRVRVIGIFGKLAIMQAAEQGRRRNQEKLTPCFF